MTAAAIRKRRPPPARAALPECPGSPPM